MQLQTKKASNKSKALVEKIVNKMEGLKKPRKYFMISVIILFLSMRGRYTFKGMQRYGKKNEKTFRLQFASKFDFLWFNLALCLDQLSQERILAFDPSYLPKSGKHTPGKGKYWSGVLGRAVPGLEIGGLGVVDLHYNTAFHLEAVQTRSPADLQEEGKTMTDHYVDLIIERASKLEEISKYLAVDGYFYKQKFIDPIKEYTSLEVISKLPKNANLKYLYKGPKRKGRGRPKKYDGKVNMKKIDKRKFKRVYQDTEVILYELVVWAVHLKRKIKVVYAEFLDEGKPTNRTAFFFSTDLDLSAKNIYRFYKARFQIEFLFRDAKQHTGLTHCQARDESKIHFHVNTSLTAVSVAKAAHYLDCDKENFKSFSIADIKTSYFNELMLDLFLSNFEINPELAKNKLAIKRILDFGKIAA